MRTGRATSSPIKLTDASGRAEEWLRPYIPAARGSAGRQPQRLWPVDAHEQRACALTYAETRDEETLRLLEPAIDAFIAQCQQPADPSSACARQTMFFFPGGMASRLLRANRNSSTVPTVSPQTFNYDPVWVDAGDPVRRRAGPRDVPATARGTFRDKGDRIIIADEALGLACGAPRAHRTLG